MAERIKENGLTALETEFQCAYATIEKDPNAAATSACAILESVCLTYLEAENHAVPAKRVLGQLWKETAKHLGLSPKDLADEDLKKILQGLFSIADGVAALRTHHGSAHGKSERGAYRLVPRHARLAVHASHTATMFLLETWDARKLN